MLDTSFRVCVSNETYEIKDCEVRRQEAKDCPRHELTNCEYGEDPTQSCKCKFVGDVDPPCDAHL